MSSVLPTVRANSGDPHSSGQKLRRRVKVREAGFNDYTAITSLESKNELATKEYEEWCHLWIGNPVYHKVRSIWPIGWVLETDDGEIVGNISNIPLWYEINGERIVAATTRAWVVDSLYRPYSLALLDQYFRQKRADLFLSTTVSPQASNGFTAFNPLRVPVGQWDRSVFWVTHYPGFLESWATMKALPMARPLAYALSVPLWFRDKSVRAALKEAQCDVQIEYCTGF